MLLEKIRRSQQSFPPRTKVYTSQKVQHAHSSRTRSSASGDGGGRCYVVLFWVCVFCSLTKARRVERPTLQRKESNKRKERTGCKGDGKGGKRRRREEREEKRIRESFERVGCLFLLKRRRPSAGQRRLDEKREQQSRRIYISTCLHQSPSSASTSPHTSTCQLIPHPFYFARRHVLHVSPSATSCRTILCFIRTRHYTHLKHPSARSLSAKITVFITCSASCLQHLLAHSGGDMLHTISIHQIIRLTLSTSQVPPTCSS